MIIRVDPIEFGEIGRVHVLEDHESVAIERRQFNSSSRENRIKVFRHPRIFLIFGFFIQPNKTKTKHKSNNKNKIIKQINWNWIEQKNRLVHFLNGRCRVTRLSTRWKRFFEKKTCRLWSLLNSSIPHWFPTFPHTLALQYLILRLMISPFV